jgi:hypothetical protein
MKDTEKIQKLLRLKNYEQPGDEYFENFLAELKQRQRADALKQSALGLLKERLVEWYRDLGSMRWVVPVGSCAVLLAGFFAAGGTSLTENEPASVNLENNGSKTRVFELRIPRSEGDTIENPLFTPQGPVMPTNFGGFREL